MTWISDETGSLPNFQQDTKPTVKSAATSLSFFTHECNLFQQVDFINIRGNTLDLCFSNINHSNITKSCDFLFEGNNNRFHYPLSICAPFRYNEYSQFKPYLEDLIFSKDKVIKRNYKKIDTKSITSALNKINWCSLLSTLDVEENCEIFYSELNSIIYEPVPNFIIFPSRFPKWFSEELKILVELKKKAHKKYKKNS